jgi:hypothetical protein
MATPVFNNGIYLRETSVKVSPHLDSYHLNNMLKQATPHDLGIVDLWAMAQKVEMPLYQFSNFGGKNIIEVDHPDGKYTWKHPIVSDLPYIVEDVEPLTTNLGESGSTFKIKLNKRAFGHGDFITYDKYNGLEMYITAEDILPSTDGFIYTVQLPKGQFLDKQFLKPGTKIERVGSARGEYGERFSDIGDVETGYREFYNYVGTAEAHAHYSISSRAELIAKKGMTTDGNLIINEIWRNFDNNLDPSITCLEDLVQKKGKSYVKKALNNGTLTRSFVTKLENASIVKISKDIERYLMWGKGGIVEQDGPDNIRMTAGLWQQLNNSFRKIFSKHSFSLDMFQTELNNFYQGKVEFDGPDPKRTIIVQTGMAGMRLINGAIKKDALGTGLSVNLDKSGLNGISGTNAMDLHYGFSFTSYTIPFLANVKFVLNPSFDNVHTNDIENPIIDGYPLSSYTFMVFDITDGKNDNIYLLKRKTDMGLRLWYQNGTMDYLGRSSGFQSSGNFNGYRVFMSQMYPAIWVKDPTKVLKFVMRNPITGGSL